jgi:hypothetical protein
VSVLLSLLPLLLLVGTLLAGRYPGERTLAARLRGARHRPRRAAGHVPFRPRRRPFAAPPPPPPAPAPAGGGRRPAAAASSAPPSPRVLRRPRRRRPTPCL